MTSKTPTLRVKRLRPDAVIPTYGSPGAIGLDLSFSCDRVGGSLCLYPGEWGTYSTGLAVAIPEGYYGRIAPRSGLAAKYGIDVLAGVIDSDYRGEIKVVLINNGSAHFWIEDHARIAQLILERADQPLVLTVDDLEDTWRGTAGFGSTGICK